MNIEQDATLNRLIRIAQRDSGQARKVAAFSLGLEEYRNVRWL